MSKIFFTGDLIKDNIKKIPKFATGGICNDAIFTKLDAFSQIDEIVKDIRDRQDNTMAMEFTKCIGELLRKNGVVPKLTEYTRNFETDKTFEARFGVSIDELDFSEHDKVFEDKIAELEKAVVNYKQAFEDKCKDYDSTSELLNKFGTENESLKQRIAELESENENLKNSIDKMATSKSEWIDRAVEWQQKYEKLENKETEKPTKRTGVIIAKEINGQNYVKLDDFMSVVNDLQAEIGT